MRKKEGLLQVVKNKLQKKEKKGKLQLIQGQEEEIRIIDDEK